MAKNHPEARELLSLTSRYALRSVAFLAMQGDVGPISGARIAAASGVPRKYLSTVLADLVRRGLLAGTRGKRGGFQLSRPARAIHLVEVVAPYEPSLSKQRICPFGNKICSDKNPCAAHEQWKAVNSTLERFLSETTLDQVAMEAPTPSRKRRKT